VALALTWPPDNHPAMIIAAEAAMSVPVSWVLASGATLAGAIAAMAKIVHITMMARIQDLKETLDRRHIASQAQEETIRKLQSDVNDLKKGCGHEACLWRLR
jgi:hypothetical protein